MAVQTSDFGPFGRRASSHRVTQESRIESETLALDRPGDRIRDGDGRTGLPEKLSPPIRAGPWQGAAASKIDAWESDAPAFASSGLAGFVYFSSGKWPRKAESMPKYPAFCHRGVDSATPNLVDARSQLVDSNSLRELRHFHGSSFVPSRSFMAFFQSPSSCHLSSDSLAI